MAIKTVAVVGASGNVGGPVVKALLDAGFRVTAITRELSTSTFAEGIEVRRADLASVESLTKALAGQDALVIAIASAQIGDQLVIIDAAIAAGVKRVVPSEFGVVPASVKHPVLKQLLAAKVNTLEYLQEKSREHPGFTWTAISNEPFFDWGLDAGLFGIDLKSKTVKLFDSGTNTVGTSRLAFVADAVVAALQREEETANQYIPLAEFIVTQSQVLKIFEEETGDKFQVINVPTADLEKAGQEAIASGDWGGAFALFLLSYSWGDDQGHGFKAEDAENAKLGLKGVNEVDVREAIREYIKTRSA